MTIRKNQTSLSEHEWDCLADAMKSLKKGKADPHWNDFVDDHRDNMMAVHTMASPEPVLAFLPWHRMFILDMEKELQDVDSGVALPYWDWPGEARIPDGLGKRLFGWMHVSRKLRLSRNIKHDDWPTQAQIDALMGISQFGGNGGFSLQLEGSVHAVVHNIIGGAMRKSKSPKDPLFFLHHAMVDKIWADWQERHDAYEWHDPDEMLPAPYGNTRVQDVMRIEDLDVSYAESTASTASSSAARRASRSVRKTAKKKAKTTRKAGRKKAKTTKSATRSAGKATRKTARKKASTIKKKASGGTAAQRRTAKKQARGVKKAARKETRADNKAAKKAARSTKQTARKKAKSTKKAARQSGRALKKAARGKK